MVHVVSSKLCLLYFRLQVTGSSTRQLFFKQKPAFEQVLKAFISVTACARARTVKLSLFCLTNLNNKTTSVKDVLCRAQAHSDHVLTPELQADSVPVSGLLCVEVEKHVLYISYMCRLKKKKMEMFS